MLSPSLPESPSGVLWRSALSLPLLCALLLGCSTGKIEAPVGQRSVQATGRPPAQYTVRAGDSVYAIAWRYKLDYRDIAQWNRLRAPFRIFPGQRLRLSKPARVAARPPKSTRPKSARPPKAQTKPRPPPAANRPEVSKPLPTKVRWRRPTKGAVLRTFKQTRTGVDIAGRYGQTIRAAAMGRVVYSGSGLLGYGKLIILKHNTRYLTAYAHNSKILVSEGEVVEAGTPIATMGNSGTDRVMLHFELRQDGKPVDPLRYIPKS